jgi:hypothetical protein
MGGFSLASHIDDAACPAADPSELEYTYDLQLPPQEDPEYIRPKPHDDEVESFAVSPIPACLGLC